MRNPRFEIECRVRSLSRSLGRSPDGPAGEGWTLTIELDTLTVLKLFIPNESLEVEHIVGEVFDPVTGMRSPTIRTIQQRPALWAGQRVTLELNLPVIDE